MVDHGIVERRLCLGCHNFLQNEFHVRGIKVYGTGCREAEGISDRNFPIRLFLVRKVTNVSDTVWKCLSNSTLIRSDYGGQHPRGDEERILRRDTVGRME